MDVAPQPLSLEEITDDLALTLVDGVGPITYRRLCARFGTAAAVLKASPQAWRQVEGVGAKLAEAIASARERRGVAELQELCRREAIEILSVRDPRYPRRLRTIHAPPSFLYVRGSLTSGALIVERPCLAMVGTRRASPYGLAQAERLAAEATRAGLLVVSGLAHGIDAAAHRGALAAGGETIAVLGGGVLRITPPAHRPLGDEIAARGCLMSEYHPHQEPSQATFPQRNRIVSGLSLGVLIVEAPVESGALITARQAREQGRVVMAIPGGVDTDRARGCHALIRAGAILVESLDDILNALTFAPATPPSIPASSVVRASDTQSVRSPKTQRLESAHASLLAQAPAPVLTPNEQAICDAIPPQGTTIDEVIATTALGVGTVLATISQLEMRRLIRRGEGNSLMCLHDFKREASEHSDY